MAGDKLFSGVLGKEGEPPRSSLDPARQQPGGEPPVLEQVVRRPPASTLEIVWVWIISFWAWFQGLFIRRTSSLKARSM